MADAKYVVKAPLVIVRNTEQGGRHEYLYQGAPVPSYVSKDELQRLADEGLVVAPDDATKAGVTPASTPSPTTETELVGTPEKPRRQPQQ